MKKWLLVLAVLLLVLVSAAAIIGYSQSGLRLLQQLTNNYSNGLVQIGRAEGRLSSSFTLGDIRVQVPGLHAQVAQVSMSWNPAALLTGKLTVTGLATKGISLDFDDTGEDKKSSSAPFSLPSIILPLRCQLNNIDLNDIAFQVEGEEVFKIDRLGGDFAASLGDIAIDDFYLYSHDVDLQLHGSVDVQHDWQLDLQGSYRFVGYGFHELRGSIAATKALSAPHVDFKVHSPGDIRVVGDVKDLFDQFSFHALLSASEVNLARLIKHCPDIMLHTVNGDINGNLEGYGGVVTATGTWGVMDNLQLDSEIRADWWGIVFDKLEIARNDGLAIARNSSINWRELFDWEGDFDFQAFDPEPLAKVLKGRLSAQFRSVGSVRDEGLNADFNIEKIAGIINERPISGTGTLHLTESGISSDNLTFTSGELAGTAHVEKGSFSWDDEMPWNVELQLQHFDPGGLHYDLYGDVSGRVSVQGSWPEDQLRGRLALTDLQGDVHGLPLTGGGELDFMGEVVETTGFRVELGEAVVDVHGRAGSDLAVDFTLDVPALQALLTGYQGTLTAKGTIGGTLANPAIEAKIGGSHLAVTGENDRVDSSISSLRGKLSLAGGKEQRVTLVVDIVDSRFGSYAVNNGRLKVDGTLTQHRIELTGNGEAIKLNISATGGYDGGWQGRIHDFTLNSQKDIWRGREPANLTLIPDHFALSKFCLERGDSALCLEGEWLTKEDKPGDWRIVTEFRSVSLAWLNTTGLLALPVDGMASGNFAANGQGDTVLGAHGNLILLKTTIALDIEDEELADLVLDDATIDLELNNGLLQARAATQIHGDGAISLDGRISGISKLTASWQPLPIEGTISLDKFDMGLISSFSGNYLQPTGKVSSTVLVGGTIGRPELEGRLKVGGGGIFLPYQGITLENLELNVLAAEDGTRIICSATSGPGRAVARGMITWQDRFSGSFAITGKDFLLVSLPEYTFRVNPALQFDFTGRQASMSGAVEVPYGRITPEEMTESVSVSEDVVFINGIHEEERSSWPVNLDIGVKLGEDVQVDGYGLTGKVAGELKVKTSSDKVLTGEGKISLKNGSFTFYGRNFDIVRGRLLFSGGALYNPGVDVRAQKKVSDEEAKGTGYTVGVDISGYVQDLQYHLFSDPYMEETEIVSRMLIGTSLANATPEEGGLLEAALVTLGVQGSGSFVKGIGNFLTVDDLHIEGSSSKEDVSLVIGKRLTDDLYIGYDVNMFSRLGQFRVRYDLTHGFAVETKSSSESTGADLLYSIER